MRPKQPRHGDSGPVVVCRGVPMELPPVTQATVFSGREFCLSTVLKHLLRLDYPADRLNRLWLVNGDKRLEEMTSRPNLPPSVYLGERVWPQHLIHGVGHRARKDAICNAWGEILKRAAEIGHDLFVVEDDIEVPSNSLRRLQAVAYEHDVMVTSGLTRSTDGGWPVFNFDMDVLRRWNGPHEEPTQADAVGTFCMYLRHELFGMMAERHYAPNVSVPTINAQGKDIHFCHWLKSVGQSLLVVPGVRVNHWVETAPGCVTVMKEWIYE